MKRSSETVSYTHLDVYKRQAPGTAYVDANDKSIFYYVDCSVIQDYGQVETFDNEHTVYERVKVGTTDATPVSYTPLVQRRCTRSLRFSSDI